MKRVLSLAVNGEGATSRVLLITTWETLQSCMKMKKHTLGRLSSGWGCIATCQSPSCVIQGLRAWTCGFKSHLNHSLAVGFVQSLTASVPAPFPEELTAPIS